MADQFEANHGHLVRQEHADCKTNDERRLQTDVAQLRLQRL